MDTGSIIITAILIVVCIVPFVLMSTSRKKRERKTLQSLSDIANKQNCTISKHEIFDNFIIGVDETKKFVFFFKKLEDSVVEQYINLAEIQNCRVKTTAKTVEFNNSTQNIIHRIELAFTEFDKNKKDATLEFFNDEINIQLSGELQLAEKWSAQINDLLKTKE